MSKARMFAAGALVLATASACSFSVGSGDSTSPSASGAAPAPQAASASAAPAGGGAIGSYKDAQKAVIQIVADGEYIDPSTGQTAQSSGAGSGFIIDPSGIAVTNAHVVEGAGSIKVYIGGSSDEVNAKILGVSECNDLAVIDLAGDNYPFLKWAQGDPELGTDVWAAGFPLGDPQYTLVDGTIAKNNADGDTSWASLDYALQDTAEIQPGNSGGPLVAADGSVVGINYMANNATNQAQFFAIPAAVAKPVVDVLRTGEDQDSIGVNGEAFYDEQNSLAGVWVSGVRSGSPASNAGILAGDVITKLEGRDVVLAKDVTSSGPTKSGYCDVLRTKGSDQPMKIQVYRASTGEVLEGEVNNAQKPLAAISAVSSDSAAAQSDSSTSTDTGTVTYNTVTDDNGVLSVEVPDAWSEVATDPGSDYSRISASTSLDGFTNGNDPGVEYYVFDGSLTKTELKSAIKTLEADNTIGALIATCQDSEPGKVTEGDGYSYIGTTYWTCKDSDLSYYLSVRSYPDQDKFVILDAQFTTDQDIEFLNRSLASLEIK
jgi:serine protease Do